MNKTENTSLPVDQPIDIQQLTALQSRLLSMKEQILSNNSCSIGADRHSDPLDQAQEVTQSMVQLRKRALETDLLSEVELALYKMQIGEYGYCEISGELIDSRRLLANPVSRTGIEEQEKLERQRAMENTRYQHWR